MKVAYFVSRFPHCSETFIVRELDAVSARPGVDIELFALFSARGATAHPAARPWTARLHRCGAGAALAGLAWWACRRPLRLLSSIALVVHGHRSNPRTLVRALATIPIAAAHARSVRALGVGHVHAHYATYPALAAWLCRRLTNIGYSFTAHAHDVFVDRSLLARKLRDARFVVTISRFNRELLAAEAAPRGTPVHVVHCGVDPGAYVYRSRSPRGAGPVHALCVASLQEYKGHRWLLEALAHGGPALERIRLDLVGEGPLRRPLEDLAARLGLGDRVRFAGALPEEEVARKLAEADLFVLPSIVARDGQMEGLPVALIEALAAGVPVVATRLSGVPELVADGITGVLAPPADAAALADALRRVLDDPAAAATRAAAGRGVVEAAFDVRESGRRLAGLFASAPT
ncbi:MAG TPA: glycosyltransferase [Solirubrobacteraceae bacterium]|nr:glycosyltransferase [Solirubrobacteraceae bacterium]